jgi:hypothetical protein
METRRGIMAFLLAACVVMTALSLGVHRAEDRSGDRMRVGVYDNRAVAVAFVSSEAHRQTLSAWKEKHDAAQRDGDEQRMQQIEKAMDRMQWLSHRQGFGRASVDDAMASVKDQLQEVARRADVSLIVCNPDYLDPATVEQVDVTDAVVALFQPSEKTLKTVEAMKKIASMDVGFDFED